MTREEYQNRVLGCFVGKNIGGTLGMPMEWERSKNDVTYYTHDITGDPLPNDDLDIQILSVDFKIRLFKRSGSSFLYKDKIIPQVISACRQILILHPLGEFYCLKKLWYIP